MYWGLGVAKGGIFVCVNSVLLSNIGHFVVMVGTEFSE